MLQWDLAGFGEISYLHYRLSIVIRVPTHSCYAAQTFSVVEFYQALSSLENCWVQGRSSS